MNQPLAWIVSSLLVGLAVSAASACSSDDSESQATSSPDGSSSSDGNGSSDGSLRDPNANCIKPGTKNNDQGIGGYCETNADCVKGQSLCSGVFGAPDNAWFCTRPCTDDPNCGEGLYCAQDPRGVACVPIVCGVVDAGADAPGDATID